MQRKKEVLNIILQDHVFEPLLDELDASLEEVDTSLDNSGTLFLSTHSSPLELIHSLTGAFASFMRQAPITQAVSPGHVVTAKVRTSAALECSL